MIDPIFDSWLEGQFARWEQFAPQTDLVSVMPVGPFPYRAYIAEFGCTGLVQLPDGKVSEANEFTIGIRFKDDHLRRLEPLGLCWVLSPSNVWHPNVRNAVCPGHVSPGVGLVDILFQVHSILSYQNFNLGDYLNPEAAAWAFKNRDRFPIDRRPLKRRQVDFGGTEMSA